jgi:hypothetical protein
MAETDLPLTLSCVECGAEADDEAEGWKAYLTNDEPPETATYCPACAEREFES